MDQAEQLRNVVKSKQARSVSKARVITITSGKGGVGKSNIAVNLAVQVVLQKNQQLPVPLSVLEDKVL